MRFDAGHIGAASDLRTGWDGPRLLLLSAGIGISGVIVTTVLANAQSPTVALLVIAGLVVAGAMLVSPAIALQVLVFSIPFERIGRLTDDAETVAISVNRILGVVALGSLLLHAAMGKRRLRFGLPFFLYGGYTAIALLSNLWAHTPEETFRQGFAILGNLLFFFVAVNLVRDFPTAKRCIVTFLLATIVAGLFSLGDYYFGLTRQVGDAEMGLQTTRMSSTVSDGSEVRSIGANVRRLFGPTGHPTLFGLNNTMAIPFFLWILPLARGKMRLFWFLGLLLSVFCLVLSNTRAVLVVSVFVVLFALVRGLWKPSLRTIVAIGILTAVVVPFIPQDVYRRMLDPALYTTERGDSLRVRFKFWEKSWEIIQENWWHGIGAGNQTELLERITDEATGYMTPIGLKASAHNEYIWVMAEVGIFGYLFFWGFIGVVTWSSFAAAALFRRLRANQERYLLVASQSVMLCALIFAGQSEAFHYPLKAWWLLAAINFIMLAEARKRGEPVDAASD